MIHKLLAKGKVLPGIEPGSPEESYAAIVLSNQGRMIRIRSDNRYTTKPMLGSRVHNIYTFVKHATEAFVEIGNTMHARKVSVCIHFDLAFPFQSTTRPA